MWYGGGRLSKTQKTISKTKLKNLKNSIKFFQKKKSFYLIDQPCSK